MPTSKQSAATAPAGRFFRRKLVIGIATLIVIIGALAGFGQWSYQQRIEKLSDAATGVWQDQVKSIGGVPSTSSVKAPYFWESSCIDNGPCPTVSKSWLVLIDQNQEASFIQNVFQKAGYLATVNDYQTPGAAGTGTKSQVVLNVGFYSLGSNDHPPYRASSGKTWRLFNVDAYEASN